MSEATRLVQAIQYNEQERFDLSSVVAGCTAGYQSAYPQNQFKFDERGVKKQLMGSPELFAQMLDKIITNATEFSPEQSNINLTMVEKGSRVQLCISNDGPTLPDNMHEQLTDSMVSVRKLQDPDKTHLGLGLYIAKIIAEYHQGKISIQNREDHTGVVVIIDLA